MRKSIFPAPAIHPNTLYGIGEIAAMKSQLNHIGLLEYPTFSRFVQMRIVRL